MGKDTKLVYLRYLPYECTAIEEYLEQMAEKGWLLTGKQGIFLKFKKVEPEKIKYCVDILGAISDYDHNDTEDALEYREYCERAGWTYVCQNGKMQIFYTKDIENTVAIHTDAEEKYKTVFWEAIKSVGVKLIIMLMFIYLMYLWLFKSDLGFVLSSNLAIIEMIIVIMYASLTIISSINFFTWAIKARAELRRNKFMPYNNYEQHKRKNLVQYICVLIVLLIVVIGLFLDYEADKGMLILVSLIAVVFILAINIFVKSKKYSRNTNRVVIIGSSILAILFVSGVINSMIMSNIDLSENKKVTTYMPGLTSRDFGAEGRETFYSVDKSVIAKRFFYSGHDKMDTRYNLFRGKYTWVNRLYEDRTVKYNEVTQRKDTLHDGVRVYNDSKHKNFVLASKDEVVQINKPSNDMSEDEFLKLVVDKLFK